MSEKKNPKCSRYDLRALEDWLERMAAEGWELAGEWPYFEKAEGAQKRFFYIEPAKGQGGVPKALLDTCALSGWEYVCSMDKGAFYVWRSVGKDAHPPRPCELAGSWCDRRLTRHLRSWWLGEALAAVMLALWAAYLCQHAEMPLWQLLTDQSLQWSTLSLLLTVFCGLWATRREHRDLRRLRKAVRAGEYQEPVAQHAAWYEIMNWLPMVVATAVLLTTCAAVRDDESRITQEELAVYPMLHAETFGGISENCLGSRYDTVLCDTLVLREGNWTNTIDKWRWPVSATQFEVYKPHFAILAGSLEAELRDYYGMEQVETHDGIKDAWYCLGYTEAQYLLLRSGGVVLLYRTDAPDDLRGHLSEFAALSRMYQDFVLTR